MKWRNDLAGEHDTTGYMVLPQKTLAELARIRPTTKEELLTIKGFGKTKVRQLGDSLLAVINAFGNQRETKVKSTTPKVAKEPKTPSAAVTFELFGRGKSVADIATERQLSVSTIEGHLMHYVDSGELPVEVLLPAEKLNRIQTYLADHPAQTLTEVRQGLGDAITFSDIRFVQHGLRAQAAD
jgi:uncharacterized protein YpbB